MKPILVAALYFIFIISIPIHAAEPSDIPSIQLTEFGKIIQVSGAKAGFEKLLNDNPFYPDGSDYAKQLLLHYENLGQTIGKINYFTQTQERELAAHLFYLQYYSEHQSGGMIWEFEFGLREKDWFLTKIYFEKQIGADQ